MHYEAPFQLTGRRGNNAFAYEQRGASPTLHVPALKHGSLQDVQVGEAIVFEDLDEHGVLQSCAGLANFIRMDWAGVPCYVFDNHNHALYFWYSALHEGLLERGAQLVHVDQHKDMRRPDTLLRSADLDEVFRYTQEDVNVGNYIVPAMEEALVGEVHLITSEAALENRIEPNPNSILNIDLDYFAPELDYIDFDRAKAFIHQHLKHAAVVTVATSPFFIEQERAIDILHRLIQQS